MTVSTRYGLRTRRRGGRGFHEMAESPQCRIAGTRLDDANREWDKVLLRLYALNAPHWRPRHAGTLQRASWAPRGNGLPRARPAASGSGLSVKMARYDLLGDNEPFVEPPKPPGVTRATNLRGIFSRMANRSRRNRSGKRIACGCFTTNWRKRLSVRVAAISTPAALPPPRAANARHRDSD